MKCWQIRRRSCETRNACWPTRRSWIAVLQNQKEIKANQRAIIVNQRKLDQVLRNQKRIEANQGKILGNQRQILSR